MTTPEWADQQLSSDLPTLRSRGENQDCEYMESFPTQARELGKEIAAFAASNPGMILLGVGDDGALKGLEAADTVEQRDSLLRRIEGICRGTIRPAITPVVRWAVEEGRAILVIQVPKGSEPVYYCHDIPYVRHLSQSRPAEPHEVITRVREWLARGHGVEADDASSQWLSELASLLIDTIIAAEEADGRMVNPWLSLWRTQCEYTASQLRDMAIQDAVIEHDAADMLKSLANALDEVAHFQLYLGAGPKIAELNNKVLQKARDAKRQFIDSIPVAPASVKAALDAVTKSSRQLDGLVERMEDMAGEGRTEEMQNEVAQIGLSLLKIGHYDLRELGPSVSSQLRELGKELHLVETTRLYLDGGASIRALLERINDLNTRVAEVAKVLANQ